MSRQIAHFNSCRKEHMERECVESVKSVESVESVERVQRVRGESAFEQIKQEQRLLYTVTVWASRIAQQNNRQPTIG